MHIIFPVNSLKGKVSRKFYTCLSYRLVISKLVLSPDNYYFISHQAYYLHNITTTHYIIVILVKRELIIESVRENVSHCKT